MNRIITNTKQFICYENIANLRHFNSNEWMRYMQFDRKTYKRNLIMKTDYYEMYLLCWLPGQRTPMHDHPGNGCMFKILHGKINERLYDSNFEMIRENVHQAGSVIAIKDDVHVMENKTNNYIASLHIYSDPK